MLAMGLTVFGVGRGGLAASAWLAAACLTLHFCLVSRPDDTWRPLVENYRSASLGKLQT